ncbi:MAG: tRNA pseudouridine(55) synthase TruB [Parvibaculaceae bacterium]|nr:tRNA pseudouridine(55) synthase TruB [Parvibaculaceae bacterium]
MGRRKKGDPVSGWVIVDKPLGVTSTDTVSRVRRAYNAQKGGHAGTLDPLATGILAVALGEATKTVPFIMDATKTYRFTVRFGIATDTDDREGVPIATSELRPSDHEIEAALTCFTGEIDQLPPRFSAVRVAGERAYDLARAGEDVTLTPRRVTIHEARLVGRPDADHAEFEILCSKGTYVRSIARDMGEMLGCRGHIAVLRRTRVGPFGEAEAIPLDKIWSLGHSAADTETLSAYLCPLETALDDIPALAVSEQEAARLRQGQAVMMRGRDAPILSGSVLAMHRGNPVALTEYERGELKPVRVFQLP